MKALLKKIILENQEMPPVSGITRLHIDIPIHSGIIISIIGARRSGKTYLLKQTIQKIKSSGISDQQIIFLNFEDERLILQQNQLDLILQAYLELFPNQDMQKVHFFFDEIQNITGWEKFVRRLHDTVSKNIFITGSNARLLSSEIATELRGRSVSFSLYPYSFQEYLSLLEAPNNILTTINKAKVIQLAEKFLFTGGFPEISRLDNGLAIKMLQEYFNVMIYRDIVERYNIAAPEVLKFFIKKAISSVSGPFSINKTYNDLRSMGYKISNNYLYEYMDHCNAIFLMISIDKFSFSEIKRKKSDKKVYAVDNGLLTAIDFQFSENKGKLLENLVALEFLKHNKQIFYFKESYECDFVVVDNNQYLPVQVAFSMTEASTRQRELRGLIKACTTLKQKEGCIITFDEEEQLTAEGINISVIPFYKYFVPHYDQ